MHHLVLFARRDLQRRAAFTLQAQIRRAVYWRRFWTWRNKLDTLKEQLKSAQQLRDQLLASELKRSPLIAAIKRVVDRRRFLELREELAADTAALETVSNITEDEADPFSKFGDSSSDGSGLPQDPSSRSPEPSMRARAASLDRLSGSGAGVGLPPSPTLSGSEWNVSPSPERVLASSSLVTLSPSGTDMGSSQGGAANPLAASESALHDDASTSAAAATQRMQAGNERQHAAPTESAKARLRGMQGKPASTPPPRAQSAAAAAAARGLATPLHVGADRAAALTQARGTSAGGEHLSEEHSMRAWDLLDEAGRGETTAAAFMYGLERHPYLAQRLGLDSESARNQALSRSICTYIFIFPLSAYLRICAICTHDVWRALTHSRRTCHRLLDLSGSSAVVDKRAFVLWCSGQDSKATNTQATGARDESPGRAGGRAITQEEAQDIFRALDADSDGHSLLCCRTCTRPCLQFRLTDCSATAV